MAPPKLGLIRRWCFFCTFMILSSMDVADLYALTNRAERAQSKDQAWQDASRYPVAVRPQPEGE